MGRGALWITVPRVTNSEVGYWFRDRYLWESIFHLKFPGPRISLAWHPLLSAPISETQA